VALLLANPDAALGQDDNTNRTPLHIAAATGLDSIVPLLPYMWGIRETPLHHAVKAGHTNIVAQLLAHSPATVHAVNKRKQSVLHLAAESGRAVEVAEVLLAANASIDAVDHLKASALHRAVDKGHAELVELLLARKALVTNGRDDGHDPLIFRAVASSHHRSVAMLLAHSPQLLDTRTYHYRMNALHYATDPEIVQQLLSVNPALFEENDRDGRSPLYMAVMCSRDKVVAQMLKQCPGADVLGKNGGKAVSDVAFTLSNEQTSEVLLAHRPELIHVELSEGMLLHCVLNHEWFSQAFITKVWDWTSKQCMWSTTSRRLPFISLCEEVLIGRSI